MAITYFVQSPGLYVAYGLSTDTKPTSPPDNCLFIEIDTALIYASTAAAWVIKTTGANLSLSDITTNDANTSRHGFLRKLDGLTTTFLRGDGTWATVSGSGDMVLASVQTVSGAKTFNDGKLLLRNVANTFNGKFVNVSDGDTTYTLQNASGTLAFLSNITGTNSGTNTGDQTAIPNSTLANMATKTYKGRTSAGTGVSEDVAVATLKTDLSLVKADVGLGSVDNTTDAGKPVSTAQQTALNLKANLTSPALVTPNIGVASGTSLTVTGSLVSTGGGNGYATGAGGTVTQATSRTTTVVLNKLCGNITMFSAAQAAAAVVTFTLTNSFIAATDFLLVQHISATNGGCWHFSIVAGVGSATITIKNISAASITSATPLRFTIIKGVVV